MKKKKETNSPVDLILYKKVKDKVYRKIKKHSAYRSGIVVKEYKKRFAKRYGSNKSPYTGKKTQKKGLKRWFKEQWVNQRGEVGSKYKSDIYRPSERLTKRTPLTHKELTESEIKLARRKKYTKKRMHRFRKNID